MCVVCLMNMTQRWSSNNCTRIRWYYHLYFCISHGQCLVYGLEIHTTY